MAQNARDAAFTTSTLLVGLDTELDQLGDALAEVYDTLGSIPDNAMSVTIYRLITRFAHTRDVIERRRST
jgi:hypothetical protein